MTEVDSPEHRRFALQAARESIVLLKNRVNTLPLGPAVKTIAVIGPNADSSGVAGRELQRNAAESGVAHRRHSQTIFGKGGGALLAGRAFYAELPVPVARTAFRTAGANGKEGLKAEYFAKPQCSGKPKLVRVDPSIQFDWSAASPAPGIPKKAFAVRWTGMLIPPGPGDYAFSFQQPFCWPCTSEHTVRLYLDGKLMSSATQHNHDKEIPGFTVHFNDTAPHKFKMEYTHFGPIFHAGITFNWKRPWMLCARKR